MSHFLIRGSASASMCKQTAARRRRESTAFSIACSRSSTSSSCKITSASRAMRNAAVASTSQPGNNSGRFAAITSSSHARCTSFSEGSVMNRESCVGIGTTTNFSARDAAAGCHLGIRPHVDVRRNHQRRHVHLQASARAAAA